MTGAMALTWPVVAAVLFGALLHAGWNVLVKSSTDKALDTALISALLASALPLLLCNVVFTSRCSVATMRPAVARGRSTARAIAEMVVGPA